MTAPATPESYAGRYLEACCDLCLNADGEDLRGESRAELVVEMYGHLRHAHPDLGGVTFTVAIEGRTGRSFVETPCYRQRLTAGQRSRLAEFDALLTRPRDLALVDAVPRHVRARPEGTVG